jgi:hypothetical protein
MRRSTATLVCAGITLLACTTPDAGGGGSIEAKTPTGLERDTEIKHEPCDTTSKSAQKVDVNGDGRPDIIHVMNGGRELCRVLDLNLDGAIDVFVYYDEAARERRRESDFDRDGRPDEITVYAAGVVLRKERETNFDDKIDTWDYYEGGRLVRRERDSDGDAVVDQWWQFNNPTDSKCAVVATDRNADGKPDPDTVVDLCGEAYGTPKSGPAPGGSAAPSASPSVSAPSRSPGASPSPVAGPSPGSPAPTTPQK